MGRSLRRRVRLKSFAGRYFHRVPGTGGLWINQDEYQSVDSDWELSRLGSMSPDPNVRALPEDYPVNDEDSPITPLMYNAVGGSTIHWSAHFSRFHTSDFRVKSLDGVADDFPMSYEDLEPYFDLNDRMMGVAGISGDPHRARRHP